MASKLRKRLIQAIVSGSLAVLAVVVWNYAAPQPRIQVESVQLRKVPSTVQPGLVELVARNNGEAPANIVVRGVTYLAPVFSNARELAAANLEENLAARLEQAKPLPATGTIPVEKGRTASVNVEVPFSERAWLFARGEVTLIVVARIRYRDRVFNREKLFCQFANPRSGEWASCPFLNN